MQPKTKEQKYVFELYSKLKPLTEKQEEYASKHCFDSFYFTNNGKNKNKYYCSHCGKVSATKEKICSHCHRRIKFVAKDNKKSFASCYFNILDTVGDYQVVRHFEAHSHTKRGIAEQFSIQEVVCNFFSPNGTKTVVSRKRPMFVYYSNFSWIWGSDMEIRSRNMYACHEIRTGLTYPILKRSNLMKRNGLGRSTHGISLFSVVNELYENRCFESMWKLGYYELCKAYLSRSAFFNHYYSQVLVANRAGYLIQLEQSKEYDLWYDYINDLQRLGKDINNPILLCPHDLHKAHRDVSAIIERRRERKSREEALAEKEKHGVMDEKDNKKYLKEKGKYLNVHFGDKKIQIKILQNVDEFFQESIAMHHCVYQQRYFNRDNLVFSAKNSENKRLATIEWDINEKRIVQVRSYCNQKPKEYNQIVKLFEKNRSKIIPKKVKKKKDDKVFCSKSISC